MIAANVTEERRVPGWPTRSNVCTIARLSNKYPVPYVHLRAVFTTLKTMFMDDMRTILFLVDVWRGLHTTLGGERERAETGWNRGERASTASAASALERYTGYNRLWRQQPSSHL